jgi:(2Fe-2S) ferredoxin
MAKFETVEEGFAAAKIDGARYHIFLCLGPDCAPMMEGEKVWARLKELCAEWKLPVMRTKAGCFRVCTGGPWLLIYPDGVWYGELTPDRCERILREHIGQGKPVAEWVVKTHPLCGAGSSL